MAKAIANVNSLTDTFEQWLVTTNLLANAMSYNAVTVERSAAGANVTGNGFVNGILGANTIAIDTIKGGGSFVNVAPATAVANITLLSSVHGGNDTVNVAVTAHTFGVKTHIGGMNSTFGNAVLVIATNTTVNSTLTTSNLQFNHTANGANLIANNIFVNTQIGGVSGANLNIYTNTVVNTALFATTVHATNVYTVGVGGVSGANINFITNAVSNSTFLFNIANLQFTVANGANLTANTISVVNGVSGLSGANLNITSNAVVNTTLFTSNLNFTDTANGNVVRAVNVNTVGIGGVSGANVNFITNAVSNSTFLFSVANLQYTVANGQALTTNSAVIVNNIGGLSGANLNITTSAVVSNALFLSNLNFTGVCDYFTASNSDLGTSGSSTPILVLTVNTSVYPSAKLLVQARKGSNTEISELIMASDGSNVFTTVYGTINSPLAANVGSLSANQSGTDARLYFTQASINSNIKILATLFR